MGTGKPRKQMNLQFCIAKNDCLGDCENVIQIAQGLELPLLLFNRDEKLLDSFQGKLVTLHQNPNWVIHELGRHLQHILGERRRNQDDLRRPVHQETVRWVFL